MSVVPEIETLVLWAECLYAHEFIPWSLTLNVMTFARDLSEVVRVRWDHKDGAPV